MSIMYYSHFSDSGKEWALEYFSPVELASNGDGSLKLDIEAGLKLDCLREMMGSPLIVNSAYRDPIYNAKVGGAPMSLHKFGKAFDISIIGIDKFELSKNAKIVGFTGFGYYNSFLHVDTGKPRQWGKIW